MGHDVPWLWFCGNCAAPSPHAGPPPPHARVCPSCGLGLLLEAREDAIPSDRDAFLVVDSSLLIQAMSREAQRFLGLTEQDAVDKPIAELLVPADAEAQGRTGFAAAITQARPDRHLRPAAGGADRARGLSAASSARGLRDP